MQNDTFQTLVALVGVKSVYSFVLSRPSLRKLQPDGTFLMVLVGVGLCIAAADIDRKRTNPSIEEYARRIKLFLLIGGIPVGVWQASQSVRAFKFMLERAQRGFDGNEPHWP